MKKSILKKIGLFATLIPLSFMPERAHAMITIVVSGTVDLNFGTLTATAAGTIAVDVSGSRSTTGGVRAITGAGTASQGVFTISGSTGVNIDLSMTNPSFTVSDGAGNPMVVDNFDLVANGAGSTRVATLPVSPSSFNMGATLNVGASQAAGTYTGIYTLSANYQ